MNKVGLHCYIEEAVRTTAQEDARMIQQSELPDAARNSAQGSLARWMSMWAAKGRKYFFTHVVVDGYSPPYVRHVISMLHDIMLN